MDDNEFKEVCRKAKELLERDGWLQGDSFGTTDPSENKPRCLVGALISASPLLWWDAKNKIVYETGISLLSEWNDVPGRKKEEVLDLLDRFC